MSHKTTFTCSDTYLTTELQLTRRCTRRNCPGILTQVWVRYKDKGPLVKEEECTCCGKIVKPYNKYKKDYDAKDSRRKKPEGEVRSGRRRN
jgi:hypothetical protein